MNDIITRENLRLVLSFTSHLLVSSSVQLKWWHLNFFLVWDLTGSGYVVGQDTLLSQSLSSTRSINGYWGSVKEAWWNTWDKFVMDWHSFPSPLPPSLGNSNTPSHFMLQKLGWAPAWWATWLEYRRNHVWTVPVFSLKGLQCVLSTVGIPSSVLLKAVTAVKDTVQKQSECGICYHWNCSYH